MNKPVHNLLVVLILSLNIAVCSAYVLQKTINTDAAWVFLDKFVFNPLNFNAEGSLLITAEYDRIDDLALIIYDDQNQSIQKGRLLFFVTNCDIIKFKYIYTISMSI